MITLGDKVKDTISGFTGTAVAKTEFLNGCVQYTVIPKCGKDNKVLEGIDIDEQSLEVISTKKNTTKESSTGGKNNPATKQRGF